MIYRAICKILCDNVGAVWQTSINELIALNLHLTPVVCSYSAQTRDVIFQLDLRIGVKFILVCVGIVASCVPYLPISDIVTKCLK